MPSKWLFISVPLLIILIATAIIWELRSSLTPLLFLPNTPSTSQNQLPLADTSTANAKPDIEVIATNLEIPWEIGWLPDGSMLVTERPGRLLRISTGRQVIPIDGVQHVGEGGLLGLALHPRFSENNFLYLYLTTRASQGLINRVERYRLINDQLTDKTTIIDNIPGAQFHDGGRIAFGPDGLLYITTGDAGQSSNAQDKNSLAGKILRLKDDGSIPSDNPFGNAVYSWGHRNPQGLAWNQAGQLWATEHGRSGIRSGLDELNLIEPGKNYGWPTIEGDEEQAGLESPKLHSGSNLTWAPAGAVFLQNNLLFAGLRGEALYQARIENNQVKNLTTHFAEQFGRLRVVKLGSDGFIYLATSNRDGRGSIQEGDDKIIRLNPEVLSK